MPTRFRCLHTFLLGLLLGPLLAQPAVGQATHGEVTTVDGQTVHVQLDDSLTVDAATTGRVVQERTVGGETVQMSFAVVTVDRVEQSLDEPWVAICPIDRQSEDLQVGDRVRFETVHPRSHIAVYSTPPEATVVLDSVEVGETPLRGPIEAGTHDLQLRREGYHSTSRSFTIERGETLEIRDTLETAMGTLVVNTLPDSTTVQLDGQNLGRTPLSTEVQAGTYQLQLQQEGYMDAERTVTIRSGQEERISVPLRRPLEVELADEQADEVVDPQLSREGDRLVLEYDLVGDAEAYAVDLLLSTNGGRTFESLPESVAGAAGDEVPPGRDKQIIWAATEDLPKGLSGPGNRLRLDVEPAGGNSLYWVVGSTLAAGAGATAAAVLGAFGGGGGGGGENGGGDLPTSPPSPPD